MHPIELLIFAGRLVGVVAALAVVGWFTSRRVAKHAPTSDPIRQYLDRTAPHRTNQEPTP
jgi:hypothetical protein